MKTPFSFLNAWLDGGSPLASFIDLNTRNPSKELGGFVALDVALPVHESVDIAAESLEGSWKKVNEYVAESLKLVRATVPIWLDKYESKLIKDQLGPPPSMCHPLYFISVGIRKEERVTYIGKTSSQSGRFKGGHSAITKLHDSKFDGLEKTLYLALIVLLSDEKQYLPLEWVKPLDKAKKLLSEIEAQLIFEFKPELNLHHTVRDNAKWQTQLHIQNMTGVTEFLNDKFCYPRR